MSSAVVKKTVYAYPPSPAASRSPSPSSSRRPLRVRLRALQEELAALEAEAADPINAAADDQDLNDETTVDTSDLLKNLVEVRGRLNQLSITHLSLGKREELIDKVVRVSKVNTEKATPPRSHHTARTPSISENKVLSEMDTRVSELEKLLGSTNIPLDEVCMPAFLLPMTNASPSPRHYLLRYSLKFLECQINSTF